MMPSRDAGAPILCVVGARPNFMKIAPVIRAMKGATSPARSPRHRNCLFQ